MTQQNDKTENTETTQKNESVSNENQQEQSKENETVTESTEEKTSDTETEQSSEQTEETTANSETEQGQEGDEHIPVPEKPKNPNMELPFPGEDGMVSILSFPKRQMHQVGEALRDWLQQRGIEARIDKISKEEAEQKLEMSLDLD